MPLDATEIENLTPFIQNVIDGQASSENVADALVKRDGYGTSEFGHVFSKDYRNEGGEAFASVNLAPVEAETSNDPDALLTKLNEVIAAVNLGRTGS